MKTRFGLTPEQLVCGEDPPLPWRTIYLLDAPDDEVLVVVHAADDKAHVVRVLNPHDDLVERVLADLRKNAEPLNVPVIDMRDGAILGAC